MKLLKEDTIIGLLEKENKTVKLLIADMSVGLTTEKALSSPKIFQVAKKHGMETVIKILCVIIKSFCDSIRAKQSLDDADILECADMIAEKYTHDSIKDIVMAFKGAKAKGKIVYNLLSIQVIFEIVTEHIENKSSFLEKRELDIKSKTDGSTRTIEGTISAMHEKIQDKIEKQQEQKQLNQVKAEKREIQKLADFIDKNIDKVK